jgi:putative ABC transport system ATP-binding protein
MTAPVVELTDVTKAYPGVVALRGVNLRVERGEYVAIVGPSGSGKSTMLNVLGLLDRPTAGEYRLDGEATSGSTAERRTAVRARRIGFVFQAFHLLARRTALENVLLPMLYNGADRAGREERARAALERVGLGHRLGFHPPTLSGGERQRVAVARAIVSRPALLLADEPTGNLDRSTAAQILTLLEELHADGLSVMMITHDEHLARRASRRLRIADGRLEEVS